MPIANVVAGEFIDPTTFGNAVVDAVNSLENLGTKGYAQITASSSSFTGTLVDISGLSVTWTAVAGRRYRITYEGYVSSTVGGEYVSPVITDGAGSQLNSDQVYLPASSVVIRARCTAIWVPGAGSKTAKIRAQRTSGSGNCVVWASASAPAFILVEDIGPA